MLRVFVILILLGCQFWQNDARGFKPSEYVDHTYDSFFELERVQEQINLAEFDQELLEAALYFETCRVRDEHGLRMPSYSSALNKTSSRYAQLMVDFDFFSHFNPYKTSRSSLRERIADSKLDLDPVAENLAMTHVYNLELESAYHPMLTDSSTMSGPMLYVDLSTKQEVRLLTYKQLAQRTLAQWMASPRHRMIILNRIYTHLGCGVSLEVDNIGSATIPMIKSVQHFGAELPSGRLYTSY